MPCLVGLLALVFPRLAIILVVIFSDYIGDAYQLGFIFMPLTTLAYAWAIHAHGSVEGFHLVVVVVAALLDLGIIGGGASNRHVRRYVVVREDR